VIAAAVLTPAGALGPEAPAGHAERPAPLPAG
jgi:hypothetical protein